MSKAENDNGGQLRSKTGPARTGSLYWTKSGWRARLRVEVDGETVQKSFDLETTDKQAARVKLRRLVKQHAPVAELAAEAKRTETFKDAAERIVGDSTIRSKKARLDRLRRLVFPSLGAKPIEAIVAGDVREILTTLADGGASKEYCAKLRNDVGAVLGELWRADMLPENVCAKVRIPKHAKVDTRERAVLTDDELMRYLVWQHPSEKRRNAVLERQVMALVSRVFGGLRHGDLKAIRWESFNIGENGTFETGWAPREKTKRPQALLVPEMLRPILRDWWERAGRPRTGPVFPARRGPRAGQHKAAGSIAKYLRRDLARAFGIEAPLAEPYVRGNGRPDVRYTWKPVREMTDRERELLTDTEFTRATDFHSFRRQFKQALADAGVELQTAMALSGATDAKAHQRYLQNTAKLRAIPAAALPQLSIAHAQFSEAQNENGLFFSGRSRDRTYDFDRVKQAGETGLKRFPPVTTDPNSAPAHAGLDPSAPCTVDMHGSPERSTATKAGLLLDAALADALLSMALRGLASRAALALVAEVAGP